MLLEGKNIHKVIPQRPPFVMIDTLISSDKEKTVTGFTIENENVLVDNGILQESALIENIAQTAAAGVGYECMQNQQEVPVGFIGAIKRLELFHLPKTGDDLVTTILVKTNVMNATIVEGTVKLKDEILMKCELNIFLQK